ncbi:sensor histidine kinase [Desulfospira joergensenii]|uniref:sensor histidine kinase n=1 Tax=Desulfospira joergensenii TaxID=53329 RepID=UPI0003B4086B|nr:sensor histidine kinase [Desulfospira joergensenii]
MKTIRSRLIMIFLACFSFTAGLTALDYYHVFILEEKIGIIQQFNDFKDDVLELRRYEKNYFLTGKPVHFKQILHYLSKTETLFSGLEKEMKMVLPLKEYEECGLALKEYRRILEQEIAVEEKAEIHTQALQSRGKILTGFSERLIREKRKRLTRVLRQMLFLPFVFSTVFIILILVVMQMSRTEILEPLRKMHEAVEKAGKGVFETISYTGRGENEVFQCIFAFNKMVREIETRQEQLLQSRKMASIGTFTSGIAHELNNPINNTSLLVESLIEDEENLTPEERKALYTDLMAQADRASDIVKNLLEFSRTDQGHFKTISMSEMIDKTKQLLGNELRLQQISFHKQICDNLPKVWIDQSRLQQALVNLMLNSIQAMPRGGDLTLTVETDPSHKGYIRIDVADTGDGIPEEQLDLVFDPFFTTKKEGEGTGLGLSVTYNIIKSHNGWITVKSEPGKGTCFSIFLPVKN